MIICICRGASDNDVMKAIDRGAESLRDLQRCGIGDQCGSCHNSLKAMLTRAAAAREVQPCPSCSGVTAPSVASAMA